MTGSLGSRKETGYFSRGSGSDKRNGSVSVSFLVRKYECTFMFIVSAVRRNSGWNRQSNWLRIPDDEIRNAWQKHFGC